MVNFRKDFSIFYSPKFWGMVAAVTAFQLRDIGWISADLFEYLGTMLGFATAIGVGDSMARKVGAKK